MHGKVRLLDRDNHRRLTIENPSGASGSGGKLARAFAAALGASALKEEAAGGEGEAPRRSRKEGVTTDTKETVGLLLHSGDVLGKAAGKLNESLKIFMKGMTEQRRYQEEKKAEAAQSEAGGAENSGGGGGEAPVEGSLNLRELTFGRQVQFYHGLEELVGRPAAAEEVRQAMHSEHCEMADRHAQVYANPSPSPNPNSNSNPNPNPKPSPNLNPNQVYANNYGNCTFAELEWCCRETGVLPVVLELALVLFLETLFAVVQCVHTWAACEWILLQASHSTESRCHEVHDASTDAEL